MADTSPTFSEVPTIVHPEDLVKAFRPTPADFDLFVPWACYQLGIEHPVVVIKSVQSQYVSALTKNQKSKTKSKATTKPPTESITEIDTSSADVIGSKLEAESNAEEKTTRIEATYDDKGNLVQILLLKNSRIPRLVLKVIGLAIPYHKTLTSIVINKGLHAEALYDISHYYRTSRITEICLDNTYLPEANYHILLDNDVLLHLSLAKCHINDVVVKTIAAKLTALCPAAKSLSALNLSSNGITDVGVKYLADMLRTNRRLSYLNLADNRITDVGAINIFNTLTEFKLTNEETVEKSKRIIAYIKAKHELAAKTLCDLRNGDFEKRFQKKKAVKPPSSKKRPEKDASPNVSSILEANYAERAGNIAEEIMGSFVDPFSLENTRQEGNVVFCYGNNTLCYLNLAFNNLSYASIKKLYQVLKKQNYLYRKPKGLLNVRLEGNYLPDTCREFHMIDEMLLTGLGHKNYEPLKKRTVSRSFKNTPLSNLD